jgi:hypothetical protein
VTVHRAIGGLLAATSIGRRATTTIAASAISLAFAPGCHDVIDSRFPYVCPTSTASAALPVTLSETGLYTDLSTETLAPGVVAYRPRFELWSDGAEKRRWLALPAGSQIDTSDPDDWVFPDGTRVWKEFSRDGVRVETRLIEKSDDEWLAQAYVWRDDESDAIAAPVGYVDARGTDHDVPASGECAGCHGGRRSFVLGVSAVQLGYDAPAGELDLADLQADNALSTTIPATIALPGDADAQAALGYLHANCGHCHNSAPPARSCMDPDVHDLWLQIDDLSSVEATATFAAIDAEGDTLVRRMSRRSWPGRMPPLGSQIVDDDAIDLLERWIARLP